MTEGWGAPSWLPENVARRAALSAAAEAREDRAAEREREQRRVQREEQALSDYAAQAQLRGDYLDVAALAQGQVPRRTVPEILAAAAAAAASDDARDGLRAQRQDAAPVHIEVGEPVLHQARSANGLKIFNRARRFRDLLEARKALAAAEAAAESSKYDHGIVNGVTPRPASHRTSRSTRAVTPEPDNGIRFRSTGHIVGIY